MLSFLYFQNTNNKNNSLFFKSVAGSNFVQHFGKRPVNINCLCSTFIFFSLLIPLTHSPTPLWIWIICAHSSYKTLQYQR